ncbi:MAG TPA: hypothetical protein VHE14_07825 [Solirubrobacteraceae bacterium]|nr:hypothetical protein [Solirubrobacteraceae bacterium]
MLLVDTSGLIAAADPDDPFHRGALAVLTAARGPMLMSPFVLAELDHLLRRRAAVAARRLLLIDVARGAYRLDPFDKDDVAAAIGVIDRYADLDLDLADASIVVLAYRYQTRDVLTLDLRDFRVLPGPGGPFRVLPADAQ